MYNRRIKSWTKALTAVACVLLQALAFGAPPDWARLKEPEIVADELIVVYRDEAVVGRGQKIGLNRKWMATTSPGAIVQVHKSLQAQVKGRFKIVPAEVVELPEGADLAAAAAAYEANPSVKAVYPNYRHYPTAHTPNDPLWPELWGMTRINADDAWETFPVTNRPPVVVAVIDTGMLLTHPDLQDVLWTNPDEIPGNGMDDDFNGYVDDVNGWDFWDGDNDPSDEQGHGTHVAGTIAASMDNGIGVAGVCPAVRIMPVRGLNEYGTSASLGYAIEYVAIMSAYVRLSNNSWGGRGDDFFIGMMIEYSQYAGQLFVASAGNDRQNIDQVMTHPGGMSYDNIVCVASVNEQDDISNYSNYGIVNVDIAAPGGTTAPKTGRQIWSTWHVDQGTNGPYRAISGTSMASPHVAGAAAYLWALKPSLTYGEVAAALYDGAAVNPSLAGYVAGARQLDLMGAVGALAFNPFTPARFYGHPNEGFPISDGGVAFSELSSVWADDCTVDVAFGGDPGVWLTPLMVPTTLAAGASELLVVAIDPAAPGFPTVPGTYSNTVTVTFTPVVGAPVSVTRTIFFRLSKTYFLQSAPHAWVDPGTNALTTSQLSGAPVSLPTNLVFTYYNIVYSNLYVQPNGAVLFAPPVAALYSSGTPLPETRAEVAGLFPNWMNTTLAGGGVRGVAAVVDSRPAFVVTWSNVAHSDSTSTRFDYQVVLFDTGGDECSEIWYQYRRVGQEDDVFGMGRASTVGLQSDGGFLAAHYTVYGAWQWAPGMEYDPCPGWVDGTPMTLADAQTLCWTWGARKPDTIPPSAVITPLVLMADEIRYEIRFNEIVFDLEAADLVLRTTVPDLAIGTITGGGERFVVNIDNTVGKYGAIALRVPASSVYDLEQNWNTVVFESQLLAIPYLTMHVSDTFERGPGLWQASTNSGTTDFTDGGWEFGTPYPSVLNGPTTAFSGANCWGTFLGGPDWSSAGGYPNGWYPGGDHFAMRAQLDSPSCQVGDYPTVVFKGYWSLYGATATILAVPTASGDPVVLGTLTGDSSGTWRQCRYRLPGSLRGRELKIRIEVVSLYGSSDAGLYIDDFVVYSAEPPGVFFLEFVPVPLTVPAAATPIGVVAYNTHTGIITDVEGVFASPVDGVSVAPGARVAFGDLSIGGLATSTVPVSAAAGAYASLTIPVQGNSYVRGVYDCASYPLLVLAGMVAAAPNHFIATTGADGVRDWLNRPLRGDGGPDSAIYQILWAGPNGIIDPPAAVGTPTGDDRVLYSTGPGLPFERFGAVKVAADAGLFSRAFTHNLASGAKVYARAWDGPTFDRSVATGDSAIQTISGVAGETVVFGTWVVGTPIQYTRDLNGDNIPDGFAVANPEYALDPREFPDPAAARLRVLATAMCTRSGFRPIRVEIHKGLVYILYINNDGLNGAIEVRNAGLDTLLQTVTLGAGVANPLLNVSGLAIDRANSRLYVTESSTDRRIYRYGIAANGTLAYEATVQHQTYRPYDIAVAADGRVYVADNKTSIKRYNALLSGSPFSMMNADYPTDRVSVFGNNVYRSFLDSTYQVHRIQRWSLPGGTFSGVNYGQPQYVAPTPMVMQYGPGYLNLPAKVCEGVSGKVYVADRGNHRIQVFAAGGAFLAMTPTNAPAASSLPGYFDMPTGLCVTNDPYGDHVLYVADEKNNRVQRLTLFLDVDNDGMDDTWEGLHGLDPTDPSDAARDNEPDGLINLGEYRLRRNPNDADSDNDGRMDAYDLYPHPAVPLGTVPAVVTPPRLTAVVAPNGATVAITIFYNKNEPLNTPIQLALSGGAYLATATMAPSGTTATYTYVVQPGDAGWVTVAVSGPFQDPPVYTAVDAFELSGVMPLATLISLTATPQIVGAGASVLISAMFSEGVGDANVTIDTAEGASVVDAAAMTPAAPLPAALWTYNHVVGPVPANRWHVASVASTELDGASPLRAHFAVIDPRITAFSMPPPDITWTALTGVVYRVEARNSLISGAWGTVLTTNLAGVPTATAPLTAFPSGTAASNRFFRVVAP